MNNDPYEKLLRDIAKQYRARLTSEKFNFVRYDLEQYKELGTEVMPCISHKNLHVRDLTIPFYQMSLDKIDTSSFSKKMVRKVNRGIWSKERFRASDIVILNDTLAIISIQIGDGDSLDVLTKNKDGDWFRDCFIAFAIYD